VFHPERRQVGWHQRKESEGQLHANVQQVGPGGVQASEKGQGHKTNLNEPKKGMDKIKIVGVNRWTASAKRERG